MSDEPTPEAPPPRSLHQSMVEAARAIGPVEKNLRNEDTPYNARGIDQILDAVHEPLAEAGIVLTVDVLERETDTRGRMNYTALLVRYAFHGEDGEEFSSTVWAEATDAADKSLPKAMSAALKVLLIQTFTIPVNGPEGDADSHTNEATPNVAPTSATAEQLDELAGLLAEFQSRSDGAKYPAVWAAEGYWPLPRMRKEGCSVEAFEACARITRESIAAFDDVAEARAAGDPATDVCGSCGLVAPDHAAGCAEDTF
jgi:hypothetical protein